jgi:hypothetical protein
MKNVLAENMLRFGVKNLSESDITKIEKSVLTEAFTDVYGTVWPHFKDQKSVEALNNISITVPAGQGIYAAVFGPAEINGKENPFGGNRNAKKRLGTESTMQFSWVYWHCVALSPNPAILPSSMSAVVNNVFKVNNVSKLYKHYEQEKNIPTHPVNIYEAISNPDNIKWWDTSIEYPKGTRITRWVLFSNTYLKPNLDKVKSLYVAAAPKPATPGMQPGTAKAPVKQ